MPPRMTARTFWQDIIVMIWRISQVMIVFVPTIGAFVPTPHTMQIIWMRADTGVDIVVDATSCLKLVAIAGSNTGWPFGQLEILRNTTWG
jgi:hypothetical protein